MWMSLLFNLGMMFLSPVEIRELTWEDPFSTPVVQTPYPAQQPYLTTFAAPMPTGPIVQTAAITPQSYEVEIRPVDTPKNMARYPRMKCLLTESSPATMETYINDPEKSRPWVRLTARVMNRKVHGVDLQIQLICLDKNKKSKPEIFQTKKHVPFNMPMRLTLSSEGPEPCCVEVKVREVMPAPLNVVSNQGDGLERIGVDFNTGTPACCAQPGVCFQTAPQMTCGTQVMPTCCPPPLPCPMPMPAQQVFNAIFPTPVAPPAPTVALLPEPIPVSIPYPQPTMPVQTVALTSSPMPRMGMQMTKVSLVKVDGKSKLQYKTEATRVEVVRMKRETPMMGEVTFAAGKKYVHLSGKTWKAQAEQIDLRDDGQIVMKGHVSVTSQKNGKETRIMADEVRIQVNQAGISQILPH